MIESALHAGRLIVFRKRTEIGSSFDHRAKPHQFEEQAELAPPVPIIEDKRPLPSSRRAQLVELEDVAFASGRAILLPNNKGGGTKGDMAQRNGLDAVAAVLRHAAHTSHPLAIFGHTDTVGSDSSNLELSRDRALNALHVVTGDAETWANHCHAHFEVDDYQRVLAWIARTRGWPTDPGAIDGEFGPLTRDARATFRDRMNAEYGTALELGAKQGLEDWRAYFTLYDEALMRILSWPREELDRVRAQLQLPDPAAIGCGEAWPVESVGQNNLAIASNRRVDFVFFEPGEVPALPGEPPGHEFYGTRTYRADYIPYESFDTTVKGVARRVELGFLAYARNQISLLPAPEVSQSPWAALIAAAKHMEAAPDDAPVLFFHQHADEAEELSELRARAGYAFVRDDRDKWVELQRDHGSIRDTQQILAYLDQVKAWPTPVELTNEADDQTASAVLEFQRAYNDGYSDSIDEDGIVGPQTLGALFTALRDDLAEWFELNEADYAQLYHLPESAFLGCGSTYVAREQFGIGVNEIPAEMLDLLFVPADQALDPNTQIPGRGVYVPQLEFEVVEVGDIKAPRTHLLIIKLIDRKGSPIREAEYELRVGDDHRHGTTNAEGEIVEARLADGIPVVRLFDGRLLVFHDRYAHAIEHGEAPDEPDDPFSPDDIDAEERDPIMDVEALLAEEGGL